ncbi:MAG: polysaccharide export protein [Methylomonas sp.]|nr:polysaccharide export protein [Methylomonas sp.]
MNNNHSFVQAVGVFLVSLMLLQGCSLLTPEIETIPDNELEAAEIKDFSLDNGDELEIRVFAHENMTRKIRIPGSKVIYYPLAGEINIENMGVTDIRRTLTERLQPYLVNPQVSVEVTTMRSKTVAVLGEVAHAGALPIESNVRALDAVSKAGGFTLEAAQSSVVLVRNGKSQARMKVLDLKNVINGEGGSDNVVLRPGDILYVSRSFVADLDRFFEHIQKGLITGLLIQQGIVLYPAVVDAIEGVGESGTTVVVSPN